jgi:hypothetical protein
MTVSTVSNAEISACGKYRWWLTREWDSGEGQICWIMLNPSTADASNDDPTIRKCIKFSRAWGYRSLIVVNLFALRTPSPTEMKRASMPIGAENDSHILRAASEAQIVVAAWGKDGSFKNRGFNVAQMVNQRGIPLWCLKKAKDGAPWHPLYVRDDTQPMPYRKEAP